MRWACWLAVHLVERGRGCHRQAGGAGGEEQEGRGAPRPLPHRAPSWCPRLCHTSPLITRELLESNFPTHMEGMRSPLSSRESLLSTLTGGSAAAAAVMPGWRNPPSLYSSHTPTHTHSRTRCTVAGRLPWRSGGGRNQGETDRNSGDRLDGLRSSGGDGGGRGDGDIAGGDLGFMEDLVMLSCVCWRMRVGMAQLD